MKFALLTFGFILAVTVSAQARLGENADQLVARYGQPLKEADQKGEGIKVASADVSFQKGGFLVRVTVINGVSVSEAFNKINGQQLTIGEVRTLLAANSQGRSWNAPVASDTGKLWTRDDSATAVLDPAGVVFTIKTRELMSQEAEAKRLEQKPSLDGF